MFEKTTPEKAGISSQNVYKFIKTLEKRGLAMHSVLMMRGDKIFAEYYWHPFNKDFCHRMYSQTKSFVGVAIGLLEQEGKLSLSNKISEYFPEKIDRTLPENLKNLTIENMLTMQTCGEHQIGFIILTLTVHTFILPKTAPMLFPVPAGNTTVLPHRF